MTASCQLDIGQTLLLLSKTRLKMVVVQHWDSALVSPVAIIRLPVWHIARQAGQASILCPVASPVTCFPDLASPVSQVRSVTPILSPSRSHKPLIVDCMCERATAERDECDCLFQRASSQAERLTASSTPAA